MGLEDYLDAHNLEFTKISLQLEEYFAEQQELEFEIIENNTPQQPILMLRVSDSEGELLEDRLLGVEGGINLHLNEHLRGYKTSVESNPLPDKDGEFGFYIEIKKASVKLREDSKT